MVGCAYDDTEIWNEIEGVKDRVETLEEAVIKANEDIVALQAIVSALQKNVYVASVTPTADGYTILFSDSTSAEIKSGKDGANGTNAPVISVKQDADGNYYWTMDGEWLLVDGEKVRANGVDGEDGANGENGINDQDSIAPQVRINDTTKEWEISVDGGLTWTSTGVIAEGKDGANGANGENGSTPIISIKKDTDGNYYWTLNGEWIYVDGGKIRANGYDGNAGASGLAPQIRINQDTKEWEISTDGGLSWTTTGIRAEGSDGQNGENGDSFFKSVDVSNPDYVIITLADENVLLLARYDESAPKFIIVDAPEVAEVVFGTTAEFVVVADNIADYVANTPQGWRATYAENILAVTAPAKDLCHYDVEGVIAITVVSEDGRSLIVKLSVMAVEAKEELPYELRILTFEDEDARFEPYTLDYAGVDITTWSDLVDDPQYGGPLTYGDYTSAMYTWWDEANTELMHTFPDNYAYCFWGGGHAISNYWGEGFTDEDRDVHIAKYYGEDYVADNAGNDTMLGWFNLQMMIPVAPHSGDNFVVHYGYKDFYSYVENLPELIFADGEARVIDHMFVTNTNYTLNQLYMGVKSEAGNSFGGNWTGLTEDAWLKIVAQGFDDIDADAEPISEVEFYLVQGENVVTEWQKWDLRELGAVAKVRFNFLYSEDMGGNYGFTIPGYFAYDDVAVQFGSELVFK